MPYCNDCGNIYTGNGVYCQAHTPSSQVSPSVATPQSSTRQSNTQASSRAGLISERLMNITSSPDLHYLVDTLTIDTRRGLAVAVINNNRVQCDWCKYWFASETMLDKHHEDVSSGCTVHEECFSKSNNVVHATRHKHDRCFVPGCKSVYMIEEGWKDSVIVAHVRKEHSIKPSSTS